MTLLDHILALATAFEEAPIALGQGTLAYFDEAAWLGLWAAGLPPDTDLSTPAFLQSAANTQPSAEVLAKLQAAGQERLHSRKPTAYITGEAWLQGLPFYVDERCIVPRSLIAEIIADGSADEWLNPASQTALDLCTGNGSLAVLGALAWPDLAWTASDLSPDALAVAAINVAQHGLGQRIALQQGDGLAPFVASGQHFDLIICNPPYVNAQSMAALPPEFRAEPDLALAGGADGMDFVRPLLAALPQVLAEDGVLILEIGHEKPFFEAAFPQLPAVWLPTSAGCEQVLLLTQEMLNSSEPAL